MYFKLKLFFYKEFYRSVKNIATTLYNLPLKQVSTLIKLIFAKIYIAKTCKIIGSRELIQAKFSK